MGGGTAIVAIPLAAAAVVGFGPEHVDQIPPPNPIISGSLDGERYWVVDGREIPRCEGHPSGIETIAEQDNIVGQEWNTFGYFFGEPTADGGCAPRVADSPPDYTYFSDGGQVLGDGMLWAGALHPDVDQVRVALDGGAPFDVETFVHEDGTYYVLEVPPGTATFTVDYLVDGEVVPVPAGSPPSTSCRLTDVGRQPARPAPDARQHGEAVDDDGEDQQPTAQPGWPASQSASEARPKTSDLDRGPHHRAAVRRLGRGEGGTTRASRPAAAATPAASAARPPSPTRRTPPSPAARRGRRARARTSRRRPRDQCAGQ